jgi:hypothetical protein
MISTAVNPPQSFEIIDSLLADNYHVFHIAECEEGGEYCPNPMKRESKAANKWLASTFLSGGSILGVYLHQIVSSGK